MRILVSFPDHFSHARERDYAHTRINIHSDTCSHIFDTKLCTQHPIVHIHRIMIVQHVFVKRCSEHHSETLPTSVLMLPTVPSWPPPTVLCAHQSHHWYPPPDHHHAGFWHYVTTCTVPPPAKVTESQYSKYIGQESTISPIHALTPTKKGGAW